MNDVEHDLRALFDRKAGEVGGVAPKLPETVRKRSRRRELGTALVSGLMVLALVVGSVAAVRSLDVGGNDRTAVDDPRDAYKVFERTATVGTFTITSDSDWYLVRPATDGLCGGGEQPCEVLQLSNVDPGLDRSICDDPLPPDGVVLVVSSALELNPRNVPAWPRSIEDPNTIGRCGEGRYVHFLDQGNRYPYTAWLGQGPAAADEDVSRLLRSFQEMTLESTSLMTTGPSAYVVAGGENAAGPWRLELTRSTGDDPSANVDLTAISPEGGAGAGDFSVPYARMIEQAGGDPVFGAVTKEADGVEIRPNGILPGPAATIVPLPPSLPFDFDVFFASHEGDEPPLAVPVDAAGDPIGNMAGVSEGGDTTLFEISGTEGAITIDRSTGVTCYVVGSEQGLVDGCADDVTLQAIPLAEGRGQLLVFSTVDGTRLSGIELEVDGDETIAGSTCSGPVCVIGIPAGSGRGTLWLLQKGQRADSAPIAWTPDGVERT
jgi:hypothetical protein